MLKNQLHAEEVEAHPSTMTISRIKLINAQIGETLVETTTLIKHDEQINLAVALITSIPGIGLLTAAVMMAETNGFELIRSKSK